MPTPRDVLLEYLAKNPRPGLVVPSGPAWTKNYRRVRIESDGIRMGNDNIATLLIGTPKVILLCSGYRAYACGVLTYDPDDVYTCSEIIHRHAIIIDINMQDFHLGPIWEDILNLRVKWHLIPPRSNVSFVIMNASYKVADKVKARIIQKKEWLKASLMMGFLDEFRFSVLKFL